MEDMEEFYGFSSISNETCQERRKLLSDLICNLENQIEESSKANGSRSVKVDIMDLKWGSEIELSEDEGSLASLIDPDELPANVDELLDSHDEDIGDEEDKYYSSDDHQECSYTGNNIVDGCQLEESSTLNIVQENKTFAQELIESLLNDVLNTFDTNTNDHNITKVTNLNTGEETTELINPSPDIPTCELENVDTSNQVSGRQLRSRHTSGVSGSSSVGSSGVVTVNRSRRSSGRSSRSRHTSGESIGTEEVVQPQDDEISLEEEPLAKRKELSARRRSNVGEVGPLELSQKSLARSKSPLTEDASVVVAVITKKKLRSKEKDGFGGQAEAEADILKRVAELQSDGLWTGKKMPKKDAEYPQGKLHWDFVLEEMIWLSKVVQQEIKTKKLIAKKCAGIIQKHFKDKELAVARAERAKEANLRKIATNMSREIKIFWGNVNKLFEYRVKIKLDMKKKEALDQHLNFIVDKTEKYSTLLAESLADTAGSGVQSRAESVGPSRAESAGPSRAESEDEDVVTDNDKEYKPSGDSDDDEETIEKDEKEVDDKSQENEINMLNDEADVPIEELLKKYYPDTFGHIEAKKDTTNSQEDEDIGRGRRRKKPMDIAQIEAQIKAEELQIEAQLKSEETQLESPTELKENQIDAQIRSEEKQIEDEIKAEQKKIEAWIEAKEGKVDVDDMMAIDKKEVSRDEMEKAITEDDKYSETEETKKSADDESPMNDEDKMREDKLEEYASMAAKFQPTGNTLDTTTVKTKVPFLLKHTLREYQHIGLDWMVSLYERSLNGILADEMGLGKTIQTIAFMAHLATDLANWGPHLIVVPTSVMLNWEMEIKKWSPAFKVLVYYGNQKERRQKRVGWTKQNAFHICITSYKLVIQDHSSFRRFKWQYLILDEAQHIKNFKSQRWQLLLNFTSVGRLLLTGTPLQNNLMELWSLMHFLMPHVFDSHRDFKEWFSNPMSGMVEGNSEYNDSLIKRLHKVLRPFILRRLKKEVEKQMPSKYEHLVKCPLSKRQRFLYDDFMSRAAVKDTISSGNLLSVINVLMQLRKCCNHPNLFEPRSTLSPFVVESVSHRTPRMAADLLTYKPLIRIDLSTLPLIFTPLETKVSAYTWFRSSMLSCPASVMLNPPEPAPPSKCPRDKLRFALKSAPPLIEEIVPVSNFCQLEGPNGSVQQYIPSRYISRPDGWLWKVGVKIKAPQGYYQPVKTPIIPDIQPAKTLPIPDINDQTIAPSDSSWTPPGNEIGSPEDSLKRKAEEDGRVVLFDPYKEEFRHAKGIFSSSLFQNDRIEKSPTKLGLKRRRLDSKAREIELEMSNLTELLVTQTNRRRQLNFNLNDRKTNLKPMYGSELVELVQSMCLLPSTIIRSRLESLTCLSVSQKNEITSYSIPPKYEITPYSSTRLIPSLQHLVDNMTPIFDHFLMYIPSVHVPSVASPAKFQISSMEHKYPGDFIQTKFQIQTPDTRLIQYDCGKLQVLDNLLQKLKTGAHRALIFTQMTKMLDILEAFLNYHGYTYLRLDGSTKVEMRQCLMERFNNDNKYFIFILSTRSGGVGINLTGADTVIFYDSDWNPTMDAQAQDRCHRIGQTRDVHIYRLVSEKTIEENILKKANQKRLLGDMAIEGGNFTTAFFKKSTINDLFDVGNDDDGEDLDEEDTSEQSTSKSMGAFESALATAEDDTDIQATKEAKEEENQDENDFKEEEDQFSAILSQLSSVERYALRHMETAEAEYVQGQLDAADAEIEARKEEFDAEKLEELTQEIREEMGETSDEEEEEEVPGDQDNDEEDEDSNMDTADYRPDASESDDEKTIDKDEKEEKKDEFEISMLENEAELPIEELLKTYYPDQFKKMQKGSDESDDVIDEGGGRKKTRSRGSININLWDLENPEEALKSAPPNS